MVASSSAYSSSIAMSSARPQRGELDEMSTARLKVRDRCRSEQFNQDLSATGALLRDREQTNSYLHLGSREWRPVKGIRARILVHGIVIE